MVINSNLKRRSCFSGWLAMLYSGNNSVLEVFWNNLDELDGWVGGRTTREVFSCSRTSFIRKEGITSSGSLLLRVF